MSVYHPMIRDRHGKTSLMNMEVFPILIFNSLHLTLEIPKLHWDNLWCPLVIPEIVLNRLCVSKMTFFRKISARKNSAENYKKDIELRGFVRLYSLENSWTRDLNTRIRIEFILDNKNFKRICWECQDECYLSSILRLSYP